MNRRMVFHTLLATAGTSLLVNGASASSRKPAVKKQRSFIETDDGTRLYFQDWGKGKPLLFVAPWGLNSNWWEYQVPFLSEQGFRCIAFDRRGHGRSDSPSFGYDFDMLASDLGQFINELNLQDVTLVGHSMGCAEIVRYLSRFGSHRIRKVIMISTITPFLLKTPDNQSGLDSVIFEKGRERFRQDRPRQIKDGAAGFFAVAKNKVSDEIIQWWCHMMIEQCSMSVMLELHKAFTTTDFRNDLKSITLPTLFIHGESDTSALMSLTVNQSQPLIANSTLKTYPDAGHGIVVTHAEQINRDIMAFAT